MGLVIKRAPRVFTEHILCARLPARGQCPLPFTREVALVCGKRDAANTVLMGSAVDVSL